MSFLAHEIPSCSGVILAELVLQSPQRADRVIRQVGIEGGPLSLPSAVDLVIRSLVNEEIVTISSREIALTDHGRAVLGLVVQDTDGEPVLPAHITAGEE